MKKILRTELDEHKIRSRYNTTWLMEYSQGKMDLITNQISVLEGKVGEDTINDDDGRCCIFDLRPMHS